MNLTAALERARLELGPEAMHTHLVLSASMKSADLSRVVDRVEIFRPRKLLFANSVGQAVSPARTGK
jgi:hypothetical protein